MTQEKPEDGKVADPEETGVEVLENGWKPGEGLNCPCFGRSHEEEKPRKWPRWIDFDL